MSEYPDHLNPFKEGEKKKFGKTLSRSFRGLKGFLRQSFRQKKSKSSHNQDSVDVEIRRSYDVHSLNTLRSNVMSLPSPPTYDYTSPPLPRSRFKERLSRSSLNDTTYDERCNPFAEEEGINPFEDPPVPYRRRKSKKKAPIPPSCSNPDVHYGYKIRGSSKWSLTSSETDYTIDDKSEYSGDATYSHSLRECLDNFNKEMDSLNKGSIEMGGSSPNILAGTRAKILDETEFTTKSADVLVTHSEEINNNITYQPDSYNNDIDSTNENGESEHHEIDEKIEDLTNGYVEDEQITSDREQLEKGHEEIVVYNETKDLDSENDTKIVDEKMAFIDQEQNVSDDPEEIDAKEPSPIQKITQVEVEKYL